MNDLKSLERRMYACECVHLAMMTLCVSLPIALLFKEDDPIYRLLWALGTVIPVQLIRLICLHVNKKAIRFVLALGVFAVTVAVTCRNYHYVYYCLTCIPMLISGLFLPRPNGSLVFTVPRIATPFMAMIPYVAGQIAQVPLLSRLAISVAALMTLNCFFYLNQSRLLKDIRMSCNTEISVSSMIRQNRKVVAAFLIGGVLILTAIPFFLQAAPPQTDEVVESYVAHETPKPTPTPEIPDIVPSQSGKKLHFNLEFLSYSLGVFILIPVIALGGLIYLIFFMISRIVGRKKHIPPEIDETMTVERLEPEAADKEKERLSGYDKKIRRRYEKLIKSRVPKETQLAALTPTELEQTAGVEGDGAETIHTVYRKTRYSPEPATRESYVAFKDAIRSLAAPPRSESGKG